MSVGLFVGLISLNTEFNKHQSGVWPELRHNICVSSQHIKIHELIYSTKEQSIFQTAGNTWTTVNISSSAQHCTQAMPLCSHCSLDGVWWVHRARGSFLEKAMTYQCHPVKICSWKHHSSLMSSVHRSSGMVLRKWAILHCCKCKDPFTPITLFT